MKILTKKFEKDISERLKSLQLLIVVKNQKKNLTK
jgi:hypothetical protein